MRIVVLAALLGLVGLPAAADPMDAETRALQQAQMDALKAQQERIMQDRDKLAGIEAQSRAKARR